MKSQSTNTGPRFEPFGRRGVLRVAMWCLLAPCAAFGQAVQAMPDKVADAIARVKSGNSYGVAIEQIAEAHAVQAIPALKEQFLLSQDADSKAQIASALVRLGDADDSYWNYLIGQATDAVKSDAPFPAMFDANGKVVRGQLSPEFAVWAKAHNVSPELAAEDVVYRLPGKVLFLAETGDPRGIPLLRQALQSPNFLIAAAAGEGLAVIQDKGSIQLIISVCKRSPAEAAAEIAKSLVYFDDPQAQIAVDSYVPKNVANALREARAAGRTPFR